LEVPAPEVGAPARLLAALPESATSSANSGESLPDANARPPELMKTIDTSE
jgi:hypothetical protein